MAATKLSDDKFQQQRIFFSMLSLKAFA